MQPPALGPWPAVVESGWRSGIAGLGRWAAPRWIDDAGLADGQRKQDRWREGDSVACVMEVAALSAGRGGEVEVEVMSKLSHTRKLQLMFLRWSNGFLIACPR